MRYVTKTFSQFNATIWYCPIESAVNGCFSNLSAPLRLHISSTLMILLVYFVRFVLLLGLFDYWTTGRSEMKPHCVPIKTFKCQFKSISTHQVYTIYTARQPFAIRNVRASASASAHRFMFQYYFCCCIVLLLLLHGPWASMHKCECCWLRHNHIPLSESYLHVCTIDNASANRAQCVRNRISRRVKYLYYCTHRKPNENLCAPCFAGAFLLHQTKLKEEEKK